MVGFFILKWWLLSFNKQKKKFFFFCCCTCGGTPHRQSYIWCATTYKQPLLQKNSALRGANIIEQIDSIFIGPPHQHKEKNLCVFPSSPAEKIDLI